MKRFLCASAILFLPLLLGSCSSNSAGGYTIGKKRSAAWFSTAPASDIANHFDSYDIVELCNLWAEKFPGQLNWKLNRTQIGYALQRKGKDPMYCANPQADETSILRSEAEKAKADARKAKKEAERAKREANRAKHEACEAQWEAYRQCNASKSSSSNIYTYCQRPLC